MPEEFKPGCKRPETVKKPAATESDEPILEIKEEEQQMIKVGKPAPDFSAPGYYQGKFMNFNLSDYKGKWVLLCFYPGDFTFV